MAFLPRQVSRYGRKRVSSNVTTTCSLIIRWKCMNRNSVCISFMLPLLILLGGQCFCEPGTLQEITFSSSRVYSTGLESIKSRHFSFVITSISLLSARLPLLFVIVSLCRALFIWRQRRTTRKKSFFSYLFFVFFSSSLAQSKVRHTCICISKVKRKRLQIFISHFPL